MRRSSTLMLAIVLLAATAAVAALAGQKGKGQSPAHGHSHSQAADGRKIPPYYENPNAVKELPKTLPPEQFTHQKVRAAYQVAKDNPRLLMQLPCTCGCDRSDDHKSLLSCFTDQHGEYCGVCQDEALLAAELHSKKVPIKKIRATIIEKYLY